MVIIAPSQVRDLVDPSLQKPPNIMQIIFLVNTGLLYDYISSLPKCLTEY